MDSFRLASQSSTLKSTLTVVSNLLRNDQSILLAAKLLVLSRLLHKSLSQRPDTLPSLERLASRLAGLRQKLLRHLDRRLSRHNVGREVIVEDLTAFSLASSSSPSQVLVHFQNLRAIAIGKSLPDNETNIQTSIQQRIHLFLTSLRDVRGVFPELLGASLKLLGARSLLSDDAIFALDELNLDLHERWFGDEVKNYTPWTRHDELSKTKTGELLDEWSKQALDSLANSIKKDLAQESDIQKLAEIRKETLQSWLSNREAARGLDSRNSLQTLRQPFIARTEDLMKCILTEWHESVFRAVLDIIHNRDSLPKRIAPSLWDRSSLSIDITEGALGFRKALVDRRTGRNEFIHAVIEAHDCNAAELEKLQAAVRSMRDLRWDDDFDSDSDEESGDGMGNSTFELLSRKDPARLQQTLHEGVRDAVAFVQDRLVTSIQNDFAEHLQCDFPSSPGVSVYRALRELRQRIPRLLATIDTPSSASDAPKHHDRFRCDSLISQLQTSLITSVLKPNADSFSTSLSKLAQARSFALAALWDNGDPPLPVQPSPAVFKFLRDVVKSMARVGMDLWSEGVVTRLKERMEEDTAGRIWEVFEIINQERMLPDTEPERSAPGEEHSSGEEGKEQQDGAEPAGQAGALQNKERRQRIAHNKTIQLLFDTSYLSHALRTPQSRTESTQPRHLHTLQERLAREVGVLEKQGAMERVGKNAREYWKRTCALFGLLD